jgi:hypothetical protein
MNPDFHFVYAMDVIVCTAGVENVLRTSVCTSSTVLEAEVLWSCAQVRHAATVVSLVEFDGGEHVYRVHPINVQLVTDPVIMPAKVEHGCDSRDAKLSLLQEVVTHSTELHKPPYCMTISVHDLF